MPAGFIQSTALQISLGQISAGKVAKNNISSLQITVLQISIGKVGSDHISLAQIQPNQISALELWKLHSIGLSEKFS